MPENTPFNRRDFIRGATLTSLSIAALAEEFDAGAQAAQTSTDQPAAPPVKCAVIGLGARGREILTALAKNGSGPVVSICDTYSSPGYLKRSQDIAPTAETVAEYKKVLDNPAVQAVFIATPSHLHKQIALDAIAAGKHVYLEAPLASSLDEAKAIAQAGKAAKTIFQVGLQNRANKMHNHVRNFLTDMGKPVGARAQNHKKISWRGAAGTPEREKEMAWRCYKATSSGLAGEVGSHQFDVISWYLKALPVAVTGFANPSPKEGMEVADTIQAIVEYPGGIRLTYDATICNSYDGAYEMMMGPNFAMLIRDQRGWMFKETDSPLLGWEVYARKDKIGEETGIALVADATKLISQGKEPGKVGADVTKTALYQSVDAFLNSVRTGAKPAADALIGYQAAVMGITVNEACATGTRIEFKKEMFDL